MAQGNLQGRGQPKLRVDQLIEELSKFPAHTDVAILVRHTFDMDGAPEETAHVERDIELKPWNEQGFCILIKPA